MREILIHLQHCGASPFVTTGLTKFHKPGPRLVTATEAELARLFAAASPWMRCFLVLTAHHGLRFAEALRIAEAHYNPDDQTIRFPTKGKQTNTLPASAELQEMFRTAPKNPDRFAPLIWRIRGREITTDKGMRYHWNKLIKKAQVNPELNPHDLRRTIAVAAWKKTKDLRLIQALLGHKTLSTTALYLQATQCDDLAPIMQALADKTPAAQHLGAPYQN